MQKKWLVILGVVVVLIVGLPVLNLLFWSPQNPLTELRADDGLTDQAIATLGKKCAHCHSAEPQTPFYAGWPVAGPMIQSDIREGTRRVDYVEEITGAPDGAVSEVALAKTEYAVRSGHMPPAKYLMLHWNHGLSEAEQETLLAWTRQVRSEYHAASGLPTDLRERSIRPIVAEAEEDPAKVALGDMLFHDPRLSGDNSVSCASCHALDKGGTDQSQFSVGVGGAVGGINSPTVFNSGYFVKQFWDGRAATLEEQADGPVNNPIEMASNWDEVIVKLNEDRKFKQAFDAVYPDGYSKDNFVDAIATFERTLITPNSAFDRYLLGDENALSAQEQQGHELFESYGCERCHVGPAMGGRSFEVMGLTADYLADRGNVGEADGGRFNATGNEADRGRFKVPTLRNVALTWPYLHDGSTSDLAEVVQIMGRYQLGSEIPPEEARLIAEFLGSLTGTYDGVVLQ